MLIDTHAHLNFSDFEKNLDEVIKNSIENGVAKIICASSNIEDSEKSIEIAKKYPGVVYAAVGIHPQNVDETLKNLKTEELKNKLDKLVQNPEVVAVGECGLDYSYIPAGEEERSKEQSLLFEEQIKIAQKNNLPLIVHSRKAFDETIQILEKYYSKNYGPNGVMHCYAGGKKGLQKVIDLGFYFGIDGNVTYDQGLQNVVREIPLDKLILETDSPYLTPEPKRGLPNEPANVKITAKFVAQFLGFSFEEICTQTTKNVQKLFTKTR